MTEIQREVVDFLSYGFCSRNALANMAGVSNPTVYRLVKEENVGCNVRTADKLRRVMRIILGPKP